MKALALVPRGYVWESMGGLEAEFVDESDVQVATTLCVFWRLVKLSLGEIQKPVKSRRVLKEIGPEARLIT